MNVKVLNGISLFESLEDNELAVVANHLIRRRFAKNSVIINEGDTTNSLYLILSGKVKVFLNDKNGKEVILNVINAGDYFGEVSLFRRDRPYRRRVRFHAIRGQRLPEHRSRSCAQRCR